MKPQDRCPHVCLFPCVYTSMRGCDRMAPHPPVDMWERACLARKVSRLYDSINWVHCLRALKTGSCCLLPSRRQGHTPTFTFTGWLFIPQGHGVTVSTSAMYFYRLLATLSAPTHTVWSTACHYRSVPLKTWSVLSLQPPRAQLTPIKSRAELKLLAGCLFLDFTSCINIYSVPYPNYEMNCWLVNVHCKQTKMDS